MDSLTRVDKAMHRVMDRTTPVPKRVTGHRRPLLAVWTLALWLAVAGNLPLWARVATLGGSGSQQLALFGGLGLMVAGGMAALLSLAAWPRVFRTVGSVLALVSALNSYFMLQYGVVIDLGMLANVAQTDLREVRDLLSWPLLLTVLVVAGPPTWWIWHRPLARRGWLPQCGRNALGMVGGLALVTLAALLAFQDLASLMRNDRSLRYMISPLNTVYAATRLAADQLQDERREWLATGEDARSGPSYGSQRRPPLLLVVVGETARARNFGLNGYRRATTPALARWQATQGLVNFTQVESCGTSTQVSLPCMFSPLARAQGGDRSTDRENLLDVLQRAGLAVLWIDNQAGCKGVCARVPTVSTTALGIPDLCDGGECFDEVMLHDLDQRIAALDAQRRARGVVVVMHQMGSHGPAYFRRAPPGRKPFQPECASNTLSDCTPEALRNAYDNTIAYTDHFLDLALQWLKARADAGAWDSGLVYVSDHGESLGENGLYLHGMARALAPREQTHVPMVMWLSSGLLGRSGLDGACLRAHAGDAISHDHLFHTVLGLMDIGTGVYDRTLDALAPCAARRLVQTPQRPAS